MTEKEQKQKEKIEEIKRNFFRHSSSERTVSQKRLHFSSKLGELFTNFKLMTTVNTIAAVATLTSSSSTVCMADTDIATVGIGNKVMPSMLEKAADSIKTTLEKTYWNPMLSINDMRQYGSDTTAIRQKMEANGRFFVNPETEKVYYLTNEECAMQDVPLRARVEDTARQRESGIGESSGAKEKHRAYRQHESFFGIYQYNMQSFKNAIIWAVNQNDEVREFALDLMPSKPAMDNPVLADCQSKYRESLDRIASGEQRKVVWNDYYSCFSKARKTWLKTFGLDKIERQELGKIYERIFDQYEKAGKMSVIERFWEGSLREMYFPLCVNESELKGLSAYTLAPVISAVVHLPASASRSLDEARRGNVESIINEHGTVDGRDAGASRMWKAQRSYKPKTIKFGDEEVSVVSLEQHRSYLEFCRPDKVAEFDHKLDKYCFDCMLTPQFAYGNKKADLSQNSTAFWFQYANLVNRDHT